MCSEIDRFSSFLKRRTMSDEDNPQNSINETELKDEKDTDKEQGTLPELRPENPEKDEEKENLEDQRVELQKINEEIKTEASVSSSGESEKPIEEDNDGFRTPTSSDHRIPVITECPPAPKKAWPPPKNYLKRKGLSSPAASSRSIQFGDPSEVESFFRSASDEDNAEEMKIKKARRDDED